VTALTTVEPITKHPGRERSSAIFMLDAIDSDTDARLEGGGNGNARGLVKRGLKWETTTQTRRALERRQPFVRQGGTSRIRVISKTGHLQARIAVSRPEPGPLTSLRSGKACPASEARASSAFCGLCAAKVGALRSALETRVGTHRRPGDHFTAESVIDHDGLLKVLWCEQPPWGRCAWFFWRRFLAGFALDVAWGRGMLRNLQRRRWAFRGTAISSCRPRVLRAHPGGVRALVRSALGPRTGKPMHGERTTHTADVLQNADGHARFLPAQIALEGEGIRRRHELLNVAVFEIP